MTSSGHKGQGPPKDTRPAGVRVPAGAGSGRGDLRGLPACPHLPRGKNRDLCFQRDCRAFPLRGSHLPGVETEARPGVTGDLTRTCCAPGRRRGRCPPRLSPTRARSSLPTWRRNPGGGGRRRRLRTVVMVTRRDKEQAARAEHGGGRRGAGTRRPWWKSGGPAACRPGLQVALS